MLRPNSGLQVNNAADAIATDAIATAAAAGGTVESGEPQKFADAHDESHEYLTPGQPLAPRQLLFVPNLNGVRRSLE